MAKGEERAQSIKCENCGLDGLITVTDLDSKMVAISEGFSYRDNIVSCATCGISVFEITDGE